MAQPKRVWHISSLVVSVVVVLAAGCTSRTADAPASTHSAESKRTCAKVVDEYFAENAEALADFARTAESRTDESTPDLPSSPETDAELAELGCAEELPRLLCERMPDVYEAAGLAWSRDQEQMCGQ